MSKVYVRHDGSYEYIDDLTRYELVEALLDQSERLFRAKRRIEKLQSHPAILLVEMLRGSGE